MRRKRIALEDPVTIGVLNGIYDTYKNAYNGCTKISDKIAALSRFITIKEGFINESHLIKNEIDEKMREVVDEYAELISGIKGPRMSRNFMLDRRVDEYRGKLKLAVESLEYKVIELDQELRVADPTLNQINEVLEMYEIRKLKVSSDHYESLQSLFENCISYSMLRKHAYVLQNIIQAIGIYNYECKIVDFDNFHDGTKIVKDKKAGRPKGSYDKSAPQEKIEKKVLELAQLGKFRENGVPKPSRISEFIAENHPEITGNLKSRQLFNRVKTALNKVQ